MFEEVRERFARGELGGDQRSSHDNLFYSCLWLFLSTSDRLFDFLIAFLNLVRSGTRCSSTLRSGVLCALLKFVCKTGMSKVSWSAKRK